ncbi:adenylate kinase family protein [Infirmifilum sp. NZ]|uniref:adenylate kinase family protein n=1 Tax=Infirmifilum sp. NZ TaxID=2926850 RepID=UPI002DBBF531|nr:nucleoside monophosphate kinase [Infirmifilum sp. NZ]
MGPPGVGKGTYAAMLSQAFGIPHVSSGELLRREVASGTDLGRLVSKYMAQGELVPDSLVNRVLFERLSKPDCRRGFVLDGYPRTLSQAEALEATFPLDLAILLTAPLEVVVERLAGRLYCPACGEVYHEKWRPPARPGVCDKCGHALIKRADDAPEVVARRYSEYLSSSKALAEFYERRGKLFVFDASGDARVLCPRLVEKIEELLRGKEVVKL